MTFNPHSRTWGTSGAAPAPANSRDTSGSVAVDVKSQVFQLNPLRDARWAEFVSRHPHGSVFHSVGWLESLWRTYGYEPMVYTTTPPGSELTNGLVLCRVRSHLTGRRAVSLPFSDHCQPLVDSSADLDAILSHITESMATERWKYFELRPRWSDCVTQNFQTKLECSDEYFLHAVDLRPDIDTLFRSFQKSSVQAKIRRAERERLQYEEGSSERLLRQFYDLLIVTRRRHGVPPQPLLWFRNLVAALPGKAMIRMAFKDGVPIASILTISHENSLVYKYGCSDARFHNLGGTAFVLWKAIQDGKRSGAAEFDMGRSDCTNAGLISFKENFRAARLRLAYWRYSANGAGVHAASARRRRAVEAVFSRMPNAVLRFAGELLYRHIG